MGTFVLRYDDCMPGGRLHAAGYIRAMLQAGIEASAARDLGIANDAGAPEAEAAAWLERAGDLGVRIERPVMFGEAIEVETRLARKGPPVWRREFVFKHVDATLATGFVDCFDEAETV